VTDSAVVRFCGRTPRRQGVDALPVGLRGRIVPPLCVRHRPAAGFVECQVDTGAAEDGDDEHADAGRDRRQNGAPGPGTRPGTA
jgi:hypothetical protein